MELLANEVDYRKKNRNKKKRFQKTSTKYIGMAGRRHWLTKFTNKGSTFHNIATVTFHTTIPT